MGVLKGWFGEKMASVGMWAFLDSRVYLRIHDLIVPTRSGTTQIDHILVSCYGIFVVETKNYNGWIFGDPKQARWTQVLYGKKHSFQNPLRQNYRHIKCLSECLGLSENYFHSIIFFIGDAVFKTSMPPNVVNERLARHIGSYRELMLSSDEVSSVYRRLQELKATPTLTRSTHMNSLKARHKSNTTCPNCGAPLVTRTARRGANAGNQFLGCSQYPKCRFTRTL
ncbi:NERD domain-containing protein [Coraliomargarita algicola]|uniref:NERD domain-containing protein n=1 Tax=Coraliomargarita algicola TaxID=3092156 RepID=A0ABZ0RSF3_9BACT|nr:NERD domain-containing protein [Coraliomargarita sp. J2-16]WPJ98098.1 NERD domain-containing protein [Coraliomargarita sp. J2-16]